MTQTRIVVLVSGRGSNLRAIHEAARRDQIPIAIAGVASNNPQSEGLAWAMQQGLPVALINHRDFPLRASFDQALMNIVDGWRPDLVVLAGFMRILGAPFIRHYQDRLLNIHPALLPAFPGLNTHARALAAGHARHGATVHFVSDEVDAGPIVAQASVAVHPEDTPQSLEARVLTQEHLLLPRVIKWFAQGRLAVRHGQALLDGKPVDTDLLHVD